MRGTSPGVEAGVTGAAWLARLTSGIFNPRTQRLPELAAPRFGVLDWAAPPIILLGLPVLRLQHQAPRVGSLLRNT